jgi:hypothetical protein
MTSLAEAGRMGMPVGAGAAVAAADDSVCDGTTTTAPRGKASEAAGTGSTAWGSAVTARSLLAPAPKEAETSWTQVHWDGLGNQIKAAINKTIPTADHPVAERNFAEGRWVWAKAIGVMSEWRTAPWGSR